jgi:hypothetical protein
MLAIEILQRETERLRIVEIDPLKNVIAAGEGAKAELLEVDRTLASLEAAISKLTPQ